MGRESGKREARELALADYLPGIFKKGNAHVTLPSFIFDLSVTPTLLIHARAYIRRYHAPSTLK